RHLLGDTDGDVDLRLAGRGAEVRGRYHLRQPQQRVIGRGRLVDEDVERGAGDVAARDRVGEILLVDDAAAGAVHDAHALLHLGDGGAVHQAARLRRERRVNGEEVGARVELVERHDLDVHACRRLGGDERVEG